MAAARVDVSVWAWQILVAGLALMLGVAAGLNPVIAVGAAVGIAMVCLVVLNVTAGILLFGLLAFVDVGAGGFSPGRALGVLLAISWLAAIAARPDVREQLFSRHPAFTYVVLLFLAWIACGLVWAEAPGAVVDQVVRYALNLLIIPIAFFAIRKPGHAWALLGVFIAGSLLTSLYDIFSGRSTGVQTSQSYSRLSGAGFDPNELAATFVAATVLAFAMVWARVHSYPVRLLAAGAGSLTLLGLFATASRTGLVALGATVVFGMLFAGRGRRAPIIALAVVAGLAGVAYFGLYAAAPVRERILHPEGGTGRTDIWKIGVRMVRDEPVRGVGAGNFAVVSIHYLLEPGAILRDEFIVETPKVAHNVYLGILAETGAIGLAMFLFITGFCIVCALRAARSFAARGDPGSELLARAVAIASLSLMTANFFISDQFAKPLWLLLALGPCLLAMARPDSEAT